MHEQRKQRERDAAETKGRGGQEGKVRERVARSVLSQRQKMDMADLDASLRHLNQPRSCTKSRDPQSTRYTNAPWLSTAREKEEEQSGFIRSPS
jgi:hypothetical protein